MTAANLAMSGATSTNTVELPFPDAGVAGELVLEDTIRLTAEQNARKAEVRKQVDLSNPTNSMQVITFGTRSQKEVTGVTSQMLKGVRNKDTGAAGEALNGMMLQIRGLDLKKVKDGKEPGWFGKLVGQLSPVAQFIQKYEEVEGQIIKIDANLTEHARRLTTDIVMLDRLYDTTLVFYKDLELHIAVGEEILAELNDVVIPKAKARAEETNDLLDVQALRDISNMRDDFERRISDLRLTRQVTMQNLPSIRQTQDLDKALVNKLQSATINTIPMWQMQMAHAVTINRTRAAGKILRETNDLNNELLRANADALRDANVEIRTEVERGIFDIEAVEHANNQLIASLQDTLDITAKGKKTREETERRLVEAEDKLKRAVANVAQAQLTSAQL